MSGPFEPLEDLGFDLDESVVCIDGVCAVPGLTPDPDATTEPGTQQPEPAPRT